MAGARALIVAAVAVALVGVAAADICDEERDRTGLAVEEQVAGLVVVAVDPASGAARGGVRLGDAIVQVNDVLPGSCADLGRAVRAARRARSAVLLLVRRDGDELPLAIAAATWSEPAAPPPEVARETLPPARPSGESPPATTALPPARPPRRPAVTEPAVVPLPAETPVSLSAVVEVLEDLAPADGSPPALSVYRRALEQVEREVATLRTRETIAPETASELVGVVRYYRAARIAWEAGESRPGNERRMRRLPAGEGTTAPYFADSPAAALIEEYPFLAETVAREPSTLLAAETSGLWRPIQARGLLWEQGREALVRFQARWE